MDERSRVLMATFLGAVIGGVWGWLYMTQQGRRVRDQIEPKLDDFIGELTRARGTVEKARNAANEGWRSLNDIAGGAQGGAGPHRRGVWRPISSTTNTLIGIMAAVSVLEALLLIGCGDRRLHDVPPGHGARQRLSKCGRSRRCARRSTAILIDVKAVTARVSQQTERVDHAIHGTIDRVDETAERVKDSVRDKVNQAAGIVRGIRAVIASLLSSDDRRQPPATADTGL